MGNLTLIDKCSNAGVELETVEYIKNDKDLLHGILKAYEEQAPYISSLPLKQQLRICLTTVSFGTKMVTDYQKEMKELTDSLKG